MPDDHPLNVEKPNLPMTDPPSAKQIHLRQSDDGSAILPAMEHFVTLLRKAKRPGLVVRLVECASHRPLPEWSALTDAAKGTLPLASRRTMYQTIAAFDPDIQQRIECAAERVLLLDDEYGAQAVHSLLDERDADDASVLAMPSDRYSRALYLYLRQEFPERGTRAEQRFDHAERLQVMHRQWKSDHYSSHYLGPKGVLPHIDAEVEDRLRARIATLFPQVDSDQILIEHFVRASPVSADRTGGKAPNEVTLHTVTSTFNGATAHFQQVAQGELVHHEEPAALSASFSWEPHTGALGVFCEDREVRRDLAILFRDVVLASSGEIHDMPMREFDLLGFATPTMLQRLEQDRVAGVEHIGILQIRVAHPFEQQTTDEANGRQIVQQLSSTLLIGRDRRDARHLYRVAQEDYRFPDLTPYRLAQVKLVFRMARQPHRRAHNIAVQITSPNGLNDRSKTEDDRKRVLAQLARIGVLREF